jgi:hypothetical protein
MARSRTSTRRRASGSDTSSPLVLRARRLFSVLGKPITRPIQARRTRRLARWNVDTAKRWRRKRIKVRVFELVSYLGAALLLATVGASAYVMIFGPPGFLADVNHRCDAYSQACGTVFGFITPLLSLALASAAFLFYRLRYVRSPVTRRAKRHPQDLVQTATRNIGTIVGRDELCRVIMEDIRSREIRRPHLVVGGVGTGKTAVLVQLTKLLAERGAIPVPIRLRDARETLNFRQLAYERFFSMTEERLLSTGEAEKVWRQLCKDDQVVVIADGLEEALAEGSADQDRDNLIRLAIQRARELRLPLVIASRPHDPLRGADATIMELDPLSEEAALEYILEGKSSDDLRRLNRIVETAGLAELPLYLQITRQLYLNDQLDHLAVGQAARKLDTRSLDRSELRFRLLDAWLDALFQGHLMAAVPLDRFEREAAVAWLSALACIGLKADTIDVKYDDYVRKPKNKQDESSITGQKPKYEAIDKEIKRIVDEKLSRRLDIRLAASWGDRLGLVEAHGDGVRFPHSIMQAYLGSRIMETALGDSVFQREAAAALKKPGREFLIALVLYSRSKAAALTEAARPALEQAGKGRQLAPALPAATPLPSGASQKQRQAGRSPVAARQVMAGMTGHVSPAPGGSTATSGMSADGPVPATAVPAIRSDGASIRDLLADSAGKAPDDVKKLDLYAAALEIDCFIQHTIHGQIAGSIKDGWSGIRGGDQRTLDEAKLGLVYRFAEAVRAIAARRDHGEQVPRPAYRELLAMGCNEHSYPVRLAIAQEIGCGGDTAFEVLHDGDGAIWQPLAWPGNDAHAKQNNAAANGRKQRKHGRNDKQSKAGQADHREEPEDRMLRSRAVCAWLTPMLVGSVQKRQADAKRELQRWVQHVGHEAPDGTGTRLSISLEIALAQGFKYAANRRRGHPHTSSEASVFLAEQATEMLENARFWFSQLTLIQALCLWEMPESDAQRPGNAGTQLNRDGRAKTRAQPHGSDPEAIVARWLELARSRDHPFVAETGKLAVRALQTRRPQRYLWIDECGVVSKVGSRAARRSSYRQYHLWIPPSTGWAALDPRAQQLVADVLLMLNLAERGQEPAKIEQRLKRIDRGDLPPCLSQDRDPLDPTRTVGATDTAPGHNCKDGCPFGLCPYPPNGNQPYRAELSEPFCHRQQTLLTAGWTRSKRPRWQAASRRNLTRFWEQMGDRARGGSIDQDGG